MNLNVGFRLSDSLLLPCKTSPRRRKSTKSTVSYKNWLHFFILLSHSFTETDSKKGKFCGKFFEKIEFFGQFHETMILA